jgi:hypothetical protein
MGRGCIEPFEHLNRREALNDLNDLNGLNGLNVLNNPKGKDM